MPPPASLYQRHHLTTLPPNSPNMEKAPARLKTQESPY